ncbi:MAG TPA: SDR family NAD(P)-dependent oxidoreductase [Blastocatellia bacterium]|nr:SDR family NAD(P)-dependent oxidoreductase [Blastocatellia bacterium]
MQITRQDVAVVTGAASGIGRALALADVNENGLEETARLAAEHGVTATTHIVNVSDNEQVAAFAGEVVARHGKASLLINNAGVGLLGSFEELSVADFEWLMGINFWGVLYGVKHFLPVLKEQPEAHIVNISSIFGLIAFPGQSACCASKFAVRGLTEALWGELKGTNVRVSTVHPGGVRTAIAASSRLGEGTRPEEHSDVAERFAQVARTTPEAAAERIVRGIRRNERKILIGTDAGVVDRIQRLLPVKYQTLLVPLFERQMMAKR